MIDVFLALGSNIGDKKSKIASALEKISCLEKTMLLQISRFYNTPPVSDIPQDNFINAACHLKTLLDPWTLFQKIEEIERLLGKLPKPKSFPRFIDIDLLFYGTANLQKEGLIIPHPEWHKRLFVLIPLLDLTEEIPLYNEKAKKTELFSLRKHISTFPKEEIEKIELAKMA